jgi:monofunctional biosynthetic peptidoglycan transglycosylase
LYLNEIEWGDGVYGADAAAQTYFGVSASGVTPDQAALMAGAIVNPRLLNIARPNSRLRNRQRIIRARMGNITPPPVITAPVDPEPVTVPDGLPEVAPETAPDAPPADEQEPATAPASPPVPQPFPGAGQP